MSQQTPEQPNSLPEIQYVRDIDGNIILNKDGSPRKRPGRTAGIPSKGYNFHSKTKLKQRIRKSVSAKKREIEKIQSKLNSHKNTLKKKKDVLDKLDASDGKIKKPAVITKEELSALRPIEQELLGEHTNVIFQPNPGPQYDFLAAPEFDVLYGGAAGGGKSFAMLVDPLRNVVFKEHRALILRKSLKELRELIDKSRELYPQAYPGAKYLQQEKIWKFPNGCSIEFGYLESDADVYQYQGQAFTWVGFDEITHLATEYPWTYLESRVRTTNPQLNVYMRATANPGGIGHAWVKERYINPSEPNVPFLRTAPNGKSISRRFIPARLADNPHLYADGRYETQLMLMPEIERRRLLDGDWNILDGIAFPEFRPDIHVVPPMILPPHWERVKAVDYGYTAPACCLWGSVDPTDGTVFIYKELYETGLEPAQLAARMTEKEQESKSSYGNDPFGIFNRDIRGVIDGQCFARTGFTGPTQGEIIIKAGHKLRPADKNRFGGKVQVHEYLRPGPKGRPKLQIFSTCTNLIRELQSLPLAKNNSEDVDTHAEDHAYDALRYLLMSRPRQETTIDRFNRYKSEVYLPADSKVGY